MWLRVTGRRIRSWLRRRDLRRRERAGIEMVKRAGRQAWYIHQEQKQRDRAATRARSGKIEASSPGPAWRGRPASQSTAAAIAITGDVEPSRGVACAGPGCWQRNTARYGLRKLPLCPACRAALEGHIHKREIPPGTERLIRRDTA